MSCVLHADRYVGVSMVARVDVCLPKSLFTFVCVCVLYMKVKEQPAILCSF